MRGIFLVTVAMLLAGCEPANISAVMRASDRDNASMETRCETCDMRYQPEMAKLFQKYDGWRMIYISEYTTGNLAGTSGVVCFERAKR